MRSLSFLSEIPAFAVFDLYIGPDTIPSFISHRFEPAEFEGLLQYLKNNNYRALGIDEYHGYLTGTLADNDRKVIITFDDGLRNNWTVIFPLLKKYGMKAVFYVNPATVSETPGPGPNLEDVWDGKLSLDQLLRTEKDYQTISWDEARVMQSSGLVDIGSHTLIHQICFTGGNIIDFQHPDSAGKPCYPWLYTAIDVGCKDLIWGAPVYPYSPRMKALRFFDDAGLRVACMEHVNANGGIDFFQDRDWRKELKEVAGQYASKHALRTRFETELEQELAIRDSLIGAKARIELELGKKCEHFAYPWNTGGDLSVLWLKELGFKTAFRGMRPWRMPRKGDDLLDLGRIEAHWIVSLPGKGRSSIWNKISGKVFGSLK